jgi:hypothetical protein
VILPGGAVSELPPYTRGVLAGQVQGYGGQTPTFCWATSSSSAGAADAAAGLGPQQGRAHPPLISHARAGSAAPWQNRVKRPKRR